MKKSFKEFVVIKESTDKDWKATSAGPPLAKGFVPPPKLRPIIRAFLNSSNIVLQKDTSGKHVTMPKKSLFLVGGPVRDFILDKPIKDMDLATNATPEQTAIILSAAGFKHGGDRSGRDGEELKLPKSIENEDGKTIEIKHAGKSDDLVWFVKGRDNSADRKAFVISALVGKEEFEIATFRKDAKVVDGDAAVDFVDNPKEDAERRDLTINSLYIELTKPDAENKNLYDPTGSGYHDLKHGVVKTVGKAEDRFKEDPLRIMRAIRFHTRFGSGELDPEIVEAIKKFKNLDEHVALERIRDEFLKGLLHPDVDSQKYLSLYKKTGLLNTVFPGLKFESAAGVPMEFTDKKDKALALAWLLQNNPVQNVEKTLSEARPVAGENKPTGWQSQEKKAIVFLLKLKEFHPDNLSQFMRAREGTGLTNQQIKEWADMFPKRDWWNKHVRTFADHQKSVSWEDAVAKGKHKAPDGTFILPNERTKVIGDMEKEKFLSNLT